MNLILFQSVCNVISKRSKFILRHIIHAINTRRFFFYEINRIVDLIVRI